MQLTDVVDAVTTSVIPPALLFTEIVSDVGNTPDEIVPIAFTLIDAVGVKAELFLLGEDFELVDGGRPIDVAADDKGAVPAFLEEFSELGGRGGFTGAVEADHEDLERAGSGE